ncbi:MAG: hypothetical protein NDF57_08010 [archaeon GBS-70-058]|nr:hypothetical protein [Candidatus Culexarchaeum nevadense]
MSNINFEATIQGFSESLSKWSEWTFSWSSELTRLIALGLNLPIQFLHIMPFTVKVDPLIHIYIELCVAGNASEALEFWERLVEEVYPYLKLPIFVSWSGEIDISPMELGLRVGRLLAKMNISPLTLKHPVNAVEELKREW